MNVFRTAIKLKCKRELALMLGAYKPHLLEPRSYCIHVKTELDRIKGTLIWPIVSDGTVSVTSKGIKITS